MNPYHAPSDSSRWAWKGLRDRYRPDQRISRGMVTAAPWIDTVLLIVFFLLCSLPFVLQPGIRIDLPVSPIGEGHPFGHTLVILMQSGPDGGPHEEIAFFDDRRFRIGSQREALREALQRAVTRRANLPLIIEADRHVRHGLLIDLFSLAAEVGVHEIHVATRPF